MFITNEVYTFKNFEPATPNSFALVSLEQIYELGGNL
jgi:hypothetical protein